DPGLGAQLADARRIGERQRILIADEVEKILERADRGRRRDLDDVRIDECLSPLAGDRHAVVAVLYEVRLTDLVEVDRRQLGVVEVRPVDALPPIACLDLSRENRAIEVAIPTDANHRLVDPHLSYPTFPLRLRIK